MHINLNSMGTRMKRRRKELKMSQAELAEKVNVSNNHISSIETGKQIPSLTTFVKICEQLDTTPDFLLLGSLHTDFYKCCQAWNLFSGFNRRNMIVGNI